MPPFQKISLLEGQFSHGAADRTTLIKQVQFVCELRRLPFRFMAQGIKKSTVPRNLHQRLFFWSDVLIYVKKE